MIAQSTSDKMSVSYFLISLPLNAFLIRVIARIRYPGDPQSGCRPRPCFDILLNA